MKTGRKSDSEIRAKLAQLKGGNAKSKSDSSSPAPSFPLGVEPNAKQNNKLRKVGKAKAEKAATVELSKKKKGAAAKKAATENAQKAVKENSEEKKVVNSDVGLNKPDDPVTQEKLKGLLTTGGFNFSDKERKALADILKP